MAGPALILGEYRRSLDDRYRLSIPMELLASWNHEATVSGSPRSGGQAVPQELDQEEAATESETPADFVLAKERPGCLSLWRGDAWQANLDAGVNVVASKLAAGRLGDSLARVQMLGRLLSSRHRSVKIAGRGRLSVPDGFRQFLDAEPGTEVMVIGAAVCIEIWQPDAWRLCLHEQIPRFSEVLDELSR